MAGGS
jgi:L-lactate dehydrogenase (cytochrome)